MRSSDWLSLWCIRCSHVTDDASDDWHLGNVRKHRYEGICNSGATDVILTVSTRYINHGCHLTTTCTWTPPVNASTRPESISQRMRASILLRHRYALKGQLVKFEDSWRCRVNVGVCRKLQKLTYHAMDLNDMNPGTEPLKMKVMLTSLNRWLKWKKSYVSFNKLFHL